MNYLVHGITAAQLSKISKELAVLKLKLMRMGIQDTESKSFMSVARPTQKDPQIASLQKPRQPEMHTTEH